MNKVFNDLIKALEQDKCVCSPKKDLISEAIFSCEKCKRYVGHYHFNDLIILTPEEYHSLLNQKEASKDESSD